MEKHYRGKNKPKKARMVKNEDYWHGLRKTNLRHFFMRLPLRKEAHNWNEHGFMPLVSKLLPLQAKNEPPFIACCFYNLALVGYKLVKYLANNNRPWKREKSPQLNS